MEKKRGRPPIKKTVHKPKKVQVIEGLQVTQADGGGDVVEVGSIEVVSGEGQMQHDPSVALDWSNLKYTSGRMSRE